METAQPSAECIAAPVPMLVSPHSNVELAVALIAEDEPHEASTGVMVDEDGARVVHGSQIVIPYNSIEDVRCRLLSVVHCRHAVNLRVVRTTG